VKGRGGIISREEGEKDEEMRMVKFGRSGGNVWRDRDARKVQRWDQERERWGWGKVERVGSGGSVWRDSDADERGVERGDGKKWEGENWRGWLEMEIQRIGRGIEAKG
jgi:hypothetical protein